MAIRGLEIEPLVRWSRRMTPGQAYLVEADLRLLGDLGWPYEEEEFAFTFLLDGGPQITVDALGESTVVLHRFGGTYGPARFVATAGEAIGEQALWLSLLTQRGILARTDKIAVTIRSPVDKPDEDSAVLSAVTSQPSNYLALLHEQPRGNVPRAIRRAAELIEEHAAEPLTVADIASASGISVRTLQEGFRRYLDTTPTAYLREVRLLHVRSELAEADPASTTVTQVATRWGFLQPGRFAAQYRERFGESPAATLRH